VWDRKTNAMRPVVSELGIERAAQQAERAARLQSLASEHLIERASHWAPAEPVAVQVEAPKAALVHAYSKGWGRMCAGTLSGAHKGQTTSNHDEVTCPKCREALERFARQAAERAARAAA
jgi:hypothetical protein